eukprot:NODE_247_length_12991_cov_0.678328.p6 type:complete len:243 gc:universal NODE_247_length_12991_cov_0.678328:3619-2891(-)
MQSGLVEIGILTEVTSTKNCRKECALKSECYRWEIPKTGKKCFLYGFVEMINSMENIDSGVSENRANEITQIDGYSCSFQNLKDVLYFYENESDFNIRYCTEYCNNDSDCIAFSAKPYSSTSCQYFYNTNTNKTKPAVDFPDSYLYFKKGNNTMPPAVISSEPLSVDAIIGIALSVVVVLLLCAYLFRKYYNQKLKFMQTESTFNLEYDPKHEILLQEQFKRQSQTNDELELEYQPRLTICE